MGKCSVAPEPGSRAWTLMGQPCMVVRNTLERMGGGSGPEVSQKWLLLGQPKGWSSLGSPDDNGCWLPQ